MFTFPEIKCANPGQILNGRREGNDFSVGSEVRFYCNEYYTLIGSTNSVCTAVGRWSHSNPTCQGIMTIRDLKTSFKYCGIK